MDVTPRTGRDDRRWPPRAPPTPRRRRKIGVSVVLARPARALGHRSCSRASPTRPMFFYNADEAVAHKTRLGTKRFRLQGTVVPGTVRRRRRDVDFDVRLQRRHGRGPPPGRPARAVQGGRAGRARGPLRRATPSQRPILVKHTARVQGRRTPIACPPMLTASPDERRPRDCRRRPRPRRRRSVGIITLGVGLRQQPPALLRDSAGTTSWLVAVGAVARVRRDGAGAHHPRLLARRTSPRTAARGTPPLFNVAALWAALEGSILLWALDPRRLHRRRRVRTFRKRLDRPARRVGHRHDARRRGVLLRC